MVLIAMFMNACFGCIIIDACCHGQLLPAGVVMSTSLRLAGWGTNFETWNKYNNVFKQRYVGHLL